MTVDVVDVSESSLVVEFPGLDDAAANRCAIALADPVRERVPGVLDAIPGARTLFVVFDPELAARPGVVRALRRRAEAVRPDLTPRAGRRLRIPVAYGGTAGPDLDELARGRGLSSQELARRHAAAEYTVSFLGFSPGFAYLSGLPAELAAPRRATPRPRVPAGSLGIGGAYTAVYPRETPGGWNLIGRSPARLFDSRVDPPSLLLPGDLVRFEPIGEKELARRLDERELARRLDEAGDSPPSDSGARARFEVLTAGLFTSVQGTPRFGLGAYGVPAGGAMDPTALSRGNARLGNAPGAPALEITLSGPALRALADVVVCVAGARFETRLNDREIALDHPTELHMGDRLVFGRAVTGARAYLCVRGGLEPGSAAESTRRLAAGDRVDGAASPGSGPPATGSRGSGGSRPEDRPVMRVLVARTSPSISAEALGRLFSAPYRISTESDRRGIRLDGPTIPLSGPADVPPEGTPLGGIQVPASGFPIVLGPDRPVTGGYVRIGTVAAEDWPVLAQAPPGTTVAFRPVTLAEIVGTDLA